MTDRIGRGGGGAFDDTDGDGVAELQEDHTDHQGGDARNIGTVDAQSLPGGTTFIDPSDSLADVNSLLSSPGKYVFEPGEHRYPDRIEPTSGDVEVVVPKGATVGFEAGADPTTSFGGSTACLIAAVPTGSIENFTLVVEGVLDPNTANISTTHGSGVYLNTVHHATVTGDGGNVVNCHVPYTFVDCDNLHVRGLYSDDYNVNDVGGGIPVVHMEGCRGFDVADVMGEGCPGDVMDANGHNEAGTLRNIVGRNITGNAVLDLNESADVTVEGVIESGSSHPGSVLVVGDTTPGQSSRPATGGDGTTIRGVIGEATNIGIQLSPQAASHKNLTIEGIDVTASGGSAINTNLAADNVLDGLTLRGKAETTSGDAAHRAFNLTDGYQTEDVTLDLELTAGAGQTGAIISNVETLRGSLYVHDCGDAGVLFQSTAAGLTMGDVLMSIVATDNGARGINFQNNGGTCGDAVIQTVARGNPTRDVVASPSTTDIEYYGVWGTSNAGGTRTVLNGVSTNAGDPSSTGQWNGQGRDGLLVYDETNSTKYWHVAGAWV